jgi:hypothetical protein
MEAPPVSEKVAALLEDCDWSLFKDIADAPRELTDSHENALLAYYYLVEYF